MQVIDQALEAELDLANTDGNDVPDREEASRMLSAYGVPQPELKQAVAGLDPAVCGTPPDRAQALIRELEPFERGWFIGAVGWCDAAGNGEWAVTLCCAEARGNTLRLFAGAGIVAGSDPTAELDETSAKFHTFLTACTGLSP